jgi:hypothetical protein
MSIIGSGVSLRGLTHEKFHYAFNLTSGITVADIGKAVSLDTTAANTVKLAADDDVILGQLIVVEDRSIEGLLVGTVALRGGFKLPIATGQTVVVGDTAIGAGAGEIKAAAAANHVDNMVVEILADDHAVVVR